MVNFSVLGSNMYNTSSLYGDVQIRPLLSTPEAYGLESSRDRVGHGPAKRPSKRPRAGIPLMGRRRSLRSLVRSGNIGGRWN